LSMPRTISSAVRLTRLTSPSADSNALKSGTPSALAQLAGDVRRFFHCARQH
jgi:hypothetical protein